MAAILLIDDDAPTRVALHRALERAGHTVLKACNGRAGLRLYRLEPTDLVITDILMPERNGLETITALRRELAFR
jgi:CheY-like chemotaxis protein